MELCSYLQEVEHSQVSVFDEEKWSCHSFYILKNVKSVLCNHCKCTHPSQSSMFICLCFGVVPMYKINSLLFQHVYPLHLNISMHILYTVLYTFASVQTG